MRKHTKAVRSLLFEAYRRNAMANERERGRPINGRWLGLGTAAAYRPVLDAGLMVFHDGKFPPRGCMGWLCLTHAGVETLAEYEGEFARVMAELNKSEYPHTAAANFQLAGGITA